MGYCSMPLACLLTWQPKLRQKGQHWAQWASRRPLTLCLPKHCHSPESSSVEPYPKELVLLADVNDLATDSQRVHQCLWNDFVCAACEEHVNEGEVEVVLKTGQMYHHC